MAVLILPPGHCGKSLELTYFDCDVSREYGIESAFCEYQPACEWLTGSNRWFCGLWGVPFRMDLLILPTRDRYSPSRSTILFPNEKVGLQLLRVVIMNRCTPWHLRPTQDIEYLPIIVDKHGFREGWIWTAAGNKVRIATISLAATIHASSLSSTTNCRHVSVIDLIVGCFYTA
jgi:hypothetical protein